MVAAMRDSRLRSADFIHSLLGFTAGRAAATAAILDPPRDCRKDFQAVNVPMSHSTSVLRPQAKSMDE